MAAEPGETVVEDATCTFCGCLCDDIAVSVNGDRITEAANACALGEAWFLSQRVQQGPVCLIEGQPATLDDGIERAAQILSQARYPVVMTVGQTTSEAFRAAVSIADRIGACVDQPSSDARGPCGIGISGGRRGHLHSGRSQEPGRPDHLLALQSGRQRPAPHEPL